MSSSRACSLVVLLVLFAAPARAQERLGVGLDVWLEGTQLAAEQWINNSRINEGNDYAAGGASASAWLLFVARDRFRAGPGLRVYGNYGSSQNNGPLLGFLTEGLFLTEYSLHVIEKFDGIVGARIGLAILVPGGDLAEEIRRLQAEGVGVWSLPRLGFLGGLNVGVRRRMSEKLWLRLDLNGQYEQLFLFLTDEVVDGLRFRKNWSTHTVRVSLMFGAEVAL